jgi:hypothetical protein
MDDSKMNLRKTSVMWNGFIWLKTVSSRRLCEHNNEHFASTKSGSFLDQMSNYYLHKKVSVLWR